MVFVAATTSSFTSSFEGIEDVEEDEEDIAKEYEGGKKEKGRGH